MATLQEFERAVAAAWPPPNWAGLGVVVAVSGGADSLALLRTLRAIRQSTDGRLIAAHFDHALRRESADDAQFVADQCQELGLACILGRADAPGTARRDGIEAAARAARYAFLQQTAERCGARFVATAHTADDQAETILHHVLRGTGLRGLAGMRRCRPMGLAVTLIRPMLDLGRGSVLEYLAAIGQRYREDPTNRDLSLTRNRIRHELIPLLQRDYSPNVLESLRRLGSLAADATAAIDLLADELLERCLVECQPRRAVVDCRPLTDQHRHLVREVFLALWRGQDWPQQAMGYDAWEALARLVHDADDEAAVSQHVLPGAITAARHGALLVLSRD